MTMRFALACLMAVGAAGPAWAEDEYVEDPARVRQQVDALARGDGSLDGFRIEVFEGGMAAHTSYLIHGTGAIETRAWDHPGAPEARSERAVSGDDVRKLLGKLLAREYWTLEGTRFVPDAPTFILRLWDGDRVYEDYSCMIEECLASPPRAAIRQLLLDFAR